MTHDAWACCIFILKQMYSYVKLSCNKCLENYLNQDVNIVHMNACLWQVKIDSPQKIKDLTVSICNICCSTMWDRYPWFLLLAIAGSHNISYKFHAKCILNFKKKSAKSSTNQCLQHTPYISTCCSQYML